MQTISKRIYRIKASRPSIPNPEAEKALTAIIECLDGLALRKSSGDPNVQEEIEATKKSAASSQTWKSVFYRIAVGTLLSGGFLFGLSGATNTVVDEITINESDPTQVTAKDDAVKAAESLATTGAVLVGTGVVSWLIGFFFGRSAKSKENKIEELEDSLLRVAEGIDVHPTHDGFMVMYSYQF